MNSNKDGIIDFEKMIRIRLIEEAIAEKYSDQEMRCPVHLSIGQEAAAVGVMSFLNKEDKIYSTHRCHAHYLAKGGDLNAMISEIHGKESVRSPTSPSKSDTETSLRYTERKLQYFVSIDYQFQPLLPKLDLDNLCLTRQEI